ncbi:MAG: hypothetical protein P4N41_22320 [Negativicutes bacterium]|nr:hypothetical protein [Negativicutes bacterium]
MRLSKVLSSLILSLLITIFLTGAVSAESYWDCVASGVERNGNRKVDMKFRLDASGNIVSGQITFTKDLKGKAPGGDYAYAGGSKLTRDDGTYEWIMEANWTGTNDNIDSSVSKNQGTVMVRKMKIQNIAEMQIKGKDGTVWFVFPHGCEYKQVSGDDKQAISNN